MSDLIIYMSVTLSYQFYMLNVITISVQNVQSQRGHCTNERRARKRDKKVRRDVI